MLFDTVQELKFWHLPLTVALKLQIGCIYVYLIVYNRVNMIFYQNVIHRFSKKKNALVSIDLLLPAVNIY